MGQVTGIIVVLLLILFVFVPLAVLDANNLDMQDIKQSINLSARVLNDAVEKDEKNMGKVAQGYELSQEEEVLINKERLMTDFYNALYLNMPSRDHYDEVKQRICVKALVYRDRFYISGNATGEGETGDRWSAPYFFTIQDANFGDIYLSIKSDKTYYYSSNQKEYISLKDLGISEEQRDDVIICKLNAIVARYTKELGVRNGLDIRIRNPEEQDLEKKVEDTYFNVLEGTTLFVVYAEDKLLNLYSRGYHYKNYSVTGYTIFQDLTENQR